MQLGKKITNFFSSSSQKKQKVEDETQQNLINSQNSQETNGHQSLPKNKDLETLLMPKGHENYSVNDKDQCPFYQIQSKVNNTNQEQPKQQEQSEIPKQKVKKEKMPQGGCPFMSSEYVTSLSFLFTNHGLDDQNVNLQNNRRQFNQYPVYLKQTIFQDDENMKKYRAMEVSHKFFIHDKFKEKGNKCMFKKKYSEAIKFYERALGVFRWLEVLDEDQMEEKYQKKLEELRLKQQQELQKKQAFDQANNLHEIPSGSDQNSTNVEEEEKVYEQEINIDQSDEAEIQAQKEQYEQFQKEQKDFRKKCKNFLTTYTDENVEFHDFLLEEKEKSSVDMIKSLMVAIYINLAVAYVRLAHFSSARVAIEDAFKFQEKSSINYFRRSQTITYNKESSLEELKSAKKDIEIAINMRQYEKVFQAQEGLLKLLNIHNSQQVYVEHDNVVEKRIKEVFEFQKNCVKYCFAKLKELEAFEQQLISEERLPPEGYSEEEESQCDMMYNEGNIDFYHILHEMSYKYTRLIEFNLENKMDTQAAICRKQLLDLKDTLFEMSFYYNLDFAKYQNFDCILEVLKEIQVDLSSERILKRLKRIKFQKMKEMFEETSKSLNFEVFKYSLEDYYKKKEEEVKLKTQEPEEEEKPKSSYIQTFTSNIFKIETIFRSFILLIILVALYYIHKNFDYFKYFIISKQV